MIILIIFFFGKKTLIVKGIVLMKTSDRGKRGLKVDIKKYTVCLLLPREGVSIIEEEEEEH